MNHFPEYENYDGMGLAELVRGGEITPAELVEAAVERIEAYNPRLNAVVNKLYDQARTAAAGELPAGPFTGVPFLIKDLLSAYAGQPLSSGSRFLRNYVPDRDSEIVRRYKASGVVIVGKTNTPEFGITPFTEPALFGPARNPWDPSCTPGGSSGGSAVAVASGMVPLAGGGDGGGSIRIPASCCGLFGLKPTRARTPTGPYMIEGWEGFAIEHVLTRTVRDSAAMLDAIAGFEIGAPYAAPHQERPFLDEVQTPPGRLRIAYTAHPFMGHAVDPECTAALEETVHLLESLGHHLEEARPEVSGEELAVAFITMLAGQTRADIEEAAALVGRRPKADDLEPSTWALVILGRALKASDYTLAVRRLFAASQVVANFFVDYDVLLTPTLSMPPFQIGSLQLSNLEKRLIRILGPLDAGWLLKAAGIVNPIASRSFDFIPYTPLFNVTGQPAMSVPLAWCQGGTPVGLQFVGRFGDEATLFRLAGQLEQARPWFDKRPPALA